MPVDDVRLSQQQRDLLRWIAEQTGILSNHDPDNEELQMLEHSEMIKRIARAKGKTIRWSTNRYFGPGHVAYVGVSEAEISSLSRSLKKLEERGFIKRIDAGRFKLTTAGHKYLVAYFLPSLASEVNREELGYPL